MIHKILHFIKEPTSVLIVINTIGNYLNIAFTAVFALIMVRILAPAEYGDLSVLLGISYVLANILELGVVASIYSTIPDLYHKQNPRVYQFVKSTFVYQTTLSVFVIFLLILFFPQLNRVIFKTEASTPTLTITALSALLFIWQNFITNILFSAKKFVLANAYINLANVVKTVCIGILALTQMVSVGSVIFVLGIVGPLTFFALAFFRSARHISPLFKAPIKRSEFSFKYTFTYFLSTQFYNLGLRMDLFLLAYFGLRQQVGFYGLSQKIVLSVITSIVSISQVLSPGFSVIQNSEELKRQVKKGLLYMLIPAGVLLAVVVTPTIVFEVVFTKDFTQSALIARMLSLPYIVGAFGTIPLLMLLYTYKKPGYILVSNIFFFGIISVGSYLTIPAFGVFGPPVMIGVAYVVAVSIQVFGVVRQLQTKPL